MHVTLRLEEEFANIMPKLQKERPELFGTPAAGMQHALAICCRRGRILGELFNLEAGRILAFLSSRLYVES